MVLTFCISMLNLPPLPQFFLSPEQGSFFGPLHSIIIIVFLWYFALSRRMLGAMKQSCCVTGRPISRMDCIIFLLLESVEVLGYVWRGGFSSLTSPSMTSTVCFCPGGDFRSCCSSVDFICNLHKFKHSACKLVLLPLKLPALYIILLYPGVRNSVKESLVQFFGVHILGYNSSGKSVI